MKTYLLMIAGALLGFSAPAAGFLYPTNPPASVQLAWDAQSGVSFNVYWGVGSRQYTNLVNTSATSLTLSNLTRGVTYYFAATAVDNASRLESDFSVEVSYSVPKPPNPPGLHPVIVLAVLRAPQADGPWQYAGMDWSLEADQAAQWFRLRLDSAPPLASERTHARELWTR